MKKSINKITDKNSYKKYILKEKNKIFTYNFKEKKCNLWSKSEFMKKYPLQEEFLDKLFSEYKSKSA